MSFADGIRLLVGLDLRGAERDLTSFGRNAASTLGNVAGVAATVGAGIASGMLVGAAAIKAVTDTGAQMEGFEVRLERLMGSAGAAKGRMGELFDFAVETPFTLDQVVGAETTLRSFGASAEEIMPGLIDFAAMTGRDLGQAAIDMGKAWTQGAKGLESDAGQIIKSMIEARSGVRAADMDIGTFHKNILDVLDNGMYAGGAKAISKTFSGMVSNLEDEWSRFKLAVADAGLFNRMKGALQITLELIDENREGIEKIAGIVSSALWAGFRGVVETAAQGVDLIEVLGFGILKGREYTLKLGEAWIAWMEPAREMMIGLVEAAAGPEAARPLRHLQQLTQFVRQDFARMAMQSEIWAGNIDVTGDKFAATYKKLNDAQTRFNDLVGEGGEAPPTPKTKDDKDKEAEKEAEKKRALMAKEMTDAYQFQAEILALDQTEDERIEGQYQERLGYLIRYHSEGLIAEQAYNDALTQIVIDRDTQLTKIMEEQNEKEIQRRQSFVASEADMFGALSNLASQASESQSKESQKAATALFYVAQGTAAAQAAINTALAISQAAASAPPPFNIPGIIAAAATGAAQELAILSTPPPTYNDTPNVMQMGRKGVVQFAEGDLFAAARRPEDLRAQVGTNQIPVQVSVYGHRAEGRFMRDHVRVAGPLRRAITGGRTLGLRSRG